MGKEGRSQKRRKLPRVVREVEKNAVAALGRREREKQKLRERENILTGGRVLDLNNCLSFYLYLFCAMKQQQESIS